ncbi:MAG: hypothetical protein PVSMB10_16830 [Pseudarthrobacter sp.]
MQSNEYIQFFDGGIEPKLENLGGKGASLVTMTSAGMPVPPGFVVTTAQFDAFMDEAGITEETHRLLADLDPEDMAQVDKVSAAIREDICSRPVPQAMRELTISAYESLMSRFDAPVPVAVRSSATAEDLPDASFAGQQDTYLWLDGVKAVTEHIRQCWGHHLPAQEQHPQRGPLHGRRSPEDGQLEGFRRGHHYGPHQR